MKKIKNIIVMLVVLSSAAIIMPGCMKLQKNFTRSTTDTLNANLNKTAWAYLKSRAYQNATPGDTIFRRMYDAIIYSGIDTNLYTAPNKTYIFFTNTMVTTKTTGLWAAVLTSANKAATSWKSYTAADVKNYLLYLILDGQYSHYNLPNINSVNAVTLAPAGTYTNNPANFKIPGFISNPTSAMQIKVLDSSIPGSNTADYPITLNSTYYVTTSDLLATNGVVDVIGAPVYPIIPQ